VALSTADVTPCVTKASFTSVGVGVFVVVMPNARGSKGTGVSVRAIVGMGDEVGGTPPNGVGVVYCPHKDAFPTQETRRQAKIIIGKRTRFTVGIIPALYAPSAVLGAEHMSSASSRNLVQSFKDTFPRFDDRISACERAIILNTVSTRDPAFQIEWQIPIRRDPFTVISPRQMDVGAV